MRINFIKMKRNLIFNWDDQKYFSNTKYSFIGEVMTFTIDGECIIGELENPSDNFCWHFEDFVKEIEASAPPRKI